MTTQPLQCSRPGCGQTFQAKADRVAIAEAGRPVYCSRECQRAAKNVTVICAGCDTAVARPVRQVERNTTGRFFCSAECRDRVGSKPRRGPTVTCTVCGEPFHRKPSSEAVFCSKTCKDADARKDQVTRDCDHCGTTYTRAASVAGRFCKKRCEEQHRTTTAKGSTNKDGYRVLSRGSGKSVLEHRVLAAETLGRPLLRAEEVHHVNGQRADNRVDGPFVLDERGRLCSGNLEVWSTSQPAGQEIGPKVQWAIDLLRLYAPEHLKDAS